MMSTSDDEITEPTRWKKSGWIAQVIKNEDDDGWAVAMTRVGDSEPALVGPWTMGRDKRNPKPLDGAAFITLVKTATEFVRRREQQLDATLHRSVIVSRGEARLTVRFDIVPDEDEPTATLTASDASGEELARVRVAPDFPFSRASAAAWVDGGFARPARG
jgi:hypothetical protein